MLNCFNAMMRSAAGILCTVGFWLAGSAASAAIIDRVEWTNATPEVKVSEELFRSNVISAAGKEYNPRTVREDVKRLMKTGCFKDVTPEPQGLTGTDRIRIIFTLKPQDTVREVRIEGNQAVKTKKLTVKVTQAKNSLLSEAKLTEDVNAIRKVYEDKGFYQTTIHSEMRRVNNHTVDVVYMVTEHPRHKINDIIFVGNSKAFPAKLLKKQIESKFSIWSWVFSTGYLNEEQLRTDSDTLTDFYTTRGYLDFKVVKVDYLVRKDGKWVTLKMLLDEGQPYKVVPAQGAAATVVDITGNKQFAKDVLLAAPSKRWKNIPVIHAGDTFNSTLERAVVDLIRAHYEPLGYVDLQVLPRHKIDSATHTVAITFEIKEGVPSTIHDIAISGNEITQDRVIRRELPILPEDKADASKIRVAKSRLMGLDYFESVDVNPVATERDDLKDLDIQVKEKKTGSLQIGAGISSEESVMGMVTVTQSNFDWRNWRNGFKGGGQRLMMQARIGTQLSDFLINFTEPWFMDQPLRMDLNLHRNQRDQNYFTQTNTGAGVNFTRPLMLDAPEESEWKNWKHSAGYRFDYVEVGEFDNGVDPKIKAEEGSKIVSAINYRISRDTRDNFKAPTQGSLLQFSAEYAPKFLGSYGDIYRLDAQGTKYIPMRKWVLKLDAELATVDSFGNTPPALFDRFFAGGAGSIRGFKRRYVGPNDGFGNNAGGDTLMRGTVELIHPIYTDMIRGSLWSDFGNVWDQAYDWQPDDLNVSVGVGLQLDLPIGPVRLDYGFPIQTCETQLSKSGRFHFNVGYMF